MPKPHEPKNQSQISGSQPEVEPFLPQSAGKCVGAPLWLSYLLEGSAGI